MNTITVFQPIKLNLEKRLYDFWVVKVWQSKIQKLSNTFNAV